MVWDDIEDTVHQPSMVIFWMVYHGVLNIDSGIGSWQCHTSSRDGLKLDWWIAHVNVMVSGCWLDEVLFVGDKT